MFVLKPLTSRSEDLIECSSLEILRENFVFFFFLFFNFPSNFKLLTRKVTVTIVKVTSQRVLLSDDKYSCVIQQRLIYDET